MFYGGLTSDVLMFNTHLSGILAFELFECVLSLKCFSSSFLFIFNCLCFLTSNCDFHGVIERERVSLLPLCWMFNSSEVIDVWATKTRYYFSWAHTARFLVHRFLFFYSCFFFSHCFPLFSSIFSVFSVHATPHRRCSHMHLPSLESRISRP